MLSRHQATPRRGTNRATRIVVSKLQARCCDAIDVRRFKFLLTVTAQITHPEVVTENKNNVRLFSREGRKRHTYTDQTE